MTDSTSIKVSKESRDSARVTKTKRGWTWDELLQEAAVALDPEEG